MRVLPGTLCDATGGSVAACVTSAVTDALGVCIAVREAVAVRDADDVRDARAVVEREGDAAQDVEDVVAVGIDSLEGGDVIADGDRGAADGDGAVDGSAAVDGVTDDDCEIGDSAAAAALRSCSIEAACVEGKDAVKSIHSSSAMSSSRIAATTADAARIRVDGGPVSLARNQSLRSHAQRNKGVSVDESHQQRLCATTAAAMQAYQAIHSIFAHEKCSVYAGQRRPLDWDQRLPPQRHP